MPRFFPHASSINKAEGTSTDIAVVTMMKRYWRHPSCSLMLFIAIIALLSFRCSLQHSSLRAQPPRSAQANASDYDDATLMELAAADPAALAVLRAANELLAGNFTLAPAKHRAVALRGLQDWLGKQRFEPTVMSELIYLIKRPIDRYHGSDGGGGADASCSRPYKSCAVVGNSGILLSSNNGKLIDSHDLVVRLNNAPAGRRYARHVGTKTGLSFLNSNVLSRCTVRGSCYCRIYGVGVPILSYICNAAHFLEHAVCNASASGAAPVIVTDPRLDMLCARLVKYYSLRRFVRATGRRAEEWKEQHEEGMFHYSSGMQAVVVAAGVCKRVSVFGFGKAGAARHHYHTGQRGELDLHDYEAEYEFYHELEARPEAVPFMRESGFRLPPVVFYR